MASLQKVVFTIASGATVSNEIGGNQLRNCRSMSIQAPATLTGTISATSGSDDADSTTFTGIQSPPGTNVTLEANKTTVFTVAPFPRFRLQSTLAEGADRVFTAWLSVGE